eukprot:SAG31_NODE_767_length_12232_cov_6.917827_3_plen_197_part_00
MLHAGPTPRGQRAHGRDDGAKHKPQSRPSGSLGQQRSDLRAYGRPWIPASSSRPLMPTRAASVIGTAPDTLGWETRTWAPAKWSSFAGPPARQALLNTQLPPLLTSSSKALCATQEHKVRRAPSATQVPAQSNSAQTASVGVDADAVPVQPITKLTSAHLNDMNDPRRLAPTDQAPLAYQRQPTKYQALIADGLGR